MKKQTPKKQAPKVLKNISGGKMCAMADEANFGPITH